MRSLSWLPLLTALCAQSAVAQTVWHLDAEVGKATYTWAVRDTSANPVTIRPWHPTIWSIRLSRDARRLGVALSIGVALGQEGGTVSNVTILPGTDLNLAELAPEVRYLVHRTAAGAELRVHAGPIADIWWPSGADPRSRLGGEAGAEFSFPWSEHWAVTLRGDAAITATYLNAEEAGSDLRLPGTMRRVRFGVGITRGL